MISVSLLVMKEIYCRIATVLKISGATQNILKCIATLNHRGLPSVCTATICLVQQHTQTSCVFQAVHFYVYDCVCMEAITEQQSEHESDFVTSVTLKYKTVLRTSPKSNCWFQRRYLYLIGKIDTCSTSVKTRRVTGYYYYYKNARHFFQI